MNIVHGVFLFFGSTAIKYSFFQNNYRNRKGAGFIPLKGAIPLEKGQ
jgi:hypothetical protein